MKKSLFSIIAVALTVATFTSCEDVPAPYDVFADDKTDQPANTIGAEGSGTQADPYNVAAILDVTNALASGAQSTEKYYMKGYVTAITEQYSTQYGNATFVISDDVAGSNAFTIYRALYLGNKKYTSGSELKVGDEVVVYGSVTNYNGKTPETVSGEAYLYSLNGSTSGGGSDQPAATVGTKDSPKTVAEAVAAINAMADNATSTEYWYVTGKVIKVTTNQTNFEKYGNLNYLISADGTESSTTLTIYSGDGLDGAKFSGIDALKAGDEVVVYGQLQKYKNANTGAVTPEMAKGNYLVKYTAGGGTPTPTPSGEAKGDGSLGNPFNAVAATNAASALASGATSADSYYISGKISTIKYQFDEEHGTATFFISDDGTSANEFQVYSTYYLDNKSWKNGDTQIAVGDDVIIYGQLTNYNGTPETASKKSYIYSLNGNGGTGGGNEDPDPTPTETFGTLDGNVLTLDCTEVVVTGTLATIALADGTTLTFAKNDGKNDPIFHDGNKEFRMYALNSVSINAGSKKIASLEFTCKAYKSGANSFTGRGNEGELTGQPGTMAIDEEANVVSFTDVNSSSFTLTNALAGKNSGGTQFRFGKLVITYAE